MHSHDLLECDFPSLVNGGPSLNLAIARKMGSDWIALTSRLQTGSCTCANTSYVGQCPRFGVHS